MADDWQDLPFSDAVLVNPGVQLRRGTEYAFVDMNAVNPASRCAYANEIRIFDGGGSRFMVGDTLMARITPCLENGKIARYCGADGAVAHGSTEFIVIRGRPGITDTSFAYYLTKWEGVRGYAISQMTGTSGRQRVPTIALDHLSVAVPSVPEQIVIAQILGTLDDKIDLNARMRVTLDTVVRRLFKSWFVNFDPVRARIAGRNVDLPAHLEALLPERLIKTAVGFVPEGWGVAPLSDHIEVTKGVSYQGDGLVDQGVPLHNLNSIFEGGGYKYEGIKYYAGDYRPRHVVQPGEVIVANTEQGHDRLLIGYAAIVPKLFGELGIASHHVYRVTIKQGSPFRPAFLCAMLNSRRMHDVVSRYANGTTVNMLPEDGLQMPLAIVPPPPLIEAFEALAHDSERRRDEMIAESRTLAAMRDTLLPKLISGELRVTDPDTFLSRVRA
jgi:type I restriction enzyme S subunit